MNSNHCNCMYNTIFHNIRSYRGKRSCIQHLPDEVLTNDRVYAAPTRRSAKKLLFTNTRLYKPHVKIAFVNVGTVSR